MRHTHSWNLFRESCDTASESYQTRKKFAGLLPERTISSISTFMCDYVKNYNSEATLSKENNPSPSGSIESEISPE
jgi:hypothetical protein